MDRRDFLKRGMQTAAVGTAAAIPAGHVLAGGRVASAVSFETPAILKDYTANDHRRRMGNIEICRREIHGCMRQHLVTSYLPGQCCYNLGEYPCQKPWDVGQYDEQELDRLKDHGIRLIHVFDEWNDSLRLFGGDKYTALNPTAFRRFVDMVHRRGMKLLAYTSTGFLQWTDPDFRQEWSPVGSRCSLGFWDMARCSPASPGWRAFLLSRLVRIMEDYAVDGIYIDAGYFTNAGKMKMPASSPLRVPAKDEMAAFEESEHYDGALADLLALIYAEVKRRGGILKLHIDGALAPPTRGLNVYDYLWVGEGVGNADDLRVATKNHRPYVIPCIDMSSATVESEDESYLHALPYLQFPLLHAGKPFTGERATIPGVKYVSADDPWMKRCREIWKHYQANPHGPHTYSWWDFFPGRPGARAKHAQWLKRYAPLVEEGTCTWLEIGESSIFTRPLPAQVVASAFVNRKSYLVLANYGHTPTELEATADYVPSDQPLAAPRRRWNLPPRSVQILRRTS